MCVCVCVLCYQKTNCFVVSSVWLDTQNASSWDKYPSNITLDMVSNHAAISVTYVVSGFKTHMD